MPLADPMVPVLVGVLCRIRYDETLVVFDSTTHFVDMTISFDSRRHRFAIISMTSLPQSFDRQILRNAILVVSDYHFTS